MRELLSHGAKCDAVGGDSGTALHFACAAGRSEVAQALLEAKPTLLGMRDGSGNTLGVSPQRCHSIHLETGLHAIAKLVRIVYVFGNVYSQHDAA